MTYRLGVDVGGTFTDVVLYDSGAPARLAGEDAEHARATSPSA